MSQILKNFLTEYGYNVIALPKSDIKPLLLLCKDKGDVTSLESPVTTLFRSDTDTPPPTNSTAATGNVAGSAKLTFDSDTGFSLLDWLLDKLKMGKLDAKLKFDQNKVLTIKYENVQEDKVDVVRLDEYLTSAKAINGKFRTFEKKLKNSELYVVNAILKSDTFSITIEDSSGASADLDATIKGIISINQNIKRTSDNSITVQSTGETPLAFAFKAQHILYDAPGFWQRLFGSDENESGFSLSNETGIVMRKAEELDTKPLQPNETAAINI